MRVVDDKGVEIGDGELGNLVAKLPLAPGAFTTLYGDDERYLNTYFKRFKVLFCYQCFQQLERFKHKKILSMNTLIEFVLLF